jgi:hypothetical protein
MRLRGTTMDDDIANTALVHREECVPVIAEGFQGVIREFTEVSDPSTCEAEECCPEPVEWRYGIGGGWAYLCARHYHSLPDATGCGCLVCTDQA